METMEIIDLTVLPKQGLYTLEEYLAIEAESEERHEFHEGEIQQMPGNTGKHELLVTALIALLMPYIRRQGGSMFGSNLKVNLPVHSRVAYPDISIVCGKPEYANESQTLLANPTVIIEVLSPSTAAYDRSAKFGYYRSLPSLEEYILFEQDMPSAELFRKNAAGRWELVEAENGILTSVALGCAIPFADVYPVA